jgi:hypothetical protein
VLQPPTVVQLPPAVPLAGVRQQQQQQQRVPQWSLEVGHQCL